MIEKFVANVRERYAFSDEEVDLLRSHMSQAAEFDAKEVMVEEGEDIGYSSLLVEGLACRSKYTADGSRQIMEFQIPGDFVDLHSFPLRCLDHSITALTPSKIVKLQHDSIYKLIEQAPRFARILWFATMLDASIHREWIVNLGVRKGPQRAAHLFCEMYHRCALVGLTDGNSYKLPITQSELSEALGLTSIHTNRVLKDLRERGLVTFQNGVVEIGDIDALCAEGGFDPDYLYLKPGERLKSLGRQPEAAA
jgi:CRP-like cAMP-binding protein